jgi:hypothetical protein
MIIKDKNVLFVAPKFHGYSNLIKEEMGNLGAKVILKHENSIGLTFRLLTKLGLSDLYRKTFNKNLMSVLNNNVIDVLFIIRGEFVTSTFLKEVKRSYKNIKVIMYQWDSVNNYDYRELIAFTDNTFSFEKTDCKKLHIQYLPLFYDGKWRNIPLISRTEVNSVLFVGALHSDRYELLLKLKDQLKDKKIITNFYLFTPFFTFVKKLFQQKTSLKALEYITFKSISKNKLLQLYSKSAVIIDIHGSFQSGLTMRTIETLGASRKLITTNESILQEPFYREKNISIIDRNNPKIDMSIFSSDFVDCNIDNLQLKNWLAFIFAK